MLLKTTSCVSSRSGRQRFRLHDIETVGRQNVDDVAFGAGRVFRNPLHAGAPHGDGVFKTRFAQTGGLDFAAQIDCARRIQTGPDADAVFARFERNLVRTDLLAFRR